MTFDKKQLADNVYYLVKKQELQLGEFEKTIGVSVGYFSRLRQPDKYELSPSVDLLVKLSQNLNCSLETLLFVPTQEMTETEMYLISVIDKLIKNTDADSVSWDYVGLDVFYNSEINQNRNFIIDVSSFNSDYYDLKCHSKFDDYNYEIVDRILVLNRLSQNFYLLKLEPEEEKSVDRYELYLYRGGEIRKICYGTSNEPNKFYQNMKGLYESIINSFTRIRIDNNVKDGLEEFLSDVDDKFD